MAGDAGLRYPVGVRLVNHAVPHKNLPWTSARPTGEVAAELDRLLAGVLGARATGPEALRELVSLLVEKCAAEFRDLVCVDVAAEPDGAPLDGELHLLGRNIVGATLRLSLASTLPTPQTGGVWPDPWRALKGDLAAPATLTEDAHRTADLAVRARCVGWLLGEFVRLNNNDRMRVETLLEQHDGALDPLAPDLDAAFDAWWPSTGLKAALDYEDWWWEEEEEEDRKGPAPQRLDDDTFSRFLRDFDAHNLQLAWCEPWRMDESETEDGGGPTGSLSDGVSRPVFPGSRLVTLLGQDLFATVRTQVTGIGGGPVAVFGIGLPFEPSNESYGVRSCLLLVGAETVAAVMINAAC